MNANLKLFTDGQEILLFRYSNPKQAMIHTEPISGLIMLPLSKQKSIPIFVALQSLKSACAFPAEKDAAAAIQSDTESGR